VVTRNQNPVERREVCGAGEPVPGPPGRSASTGRGRVPRGGVCGRSAHSCGRSARPVRGAAGLWAPGGRSAPKRLRAECRQGERSALLHALRGRSAARWLPRPGEARGQSAHKGVSGGVPAPAGGVPRSVPSAAPGQARGRSAGERGVRAECPELPAECLSRAECPETSHARRRRLRVREVLLRGGGRPPCGRSASADGRCPRAECPEVGSAGGVPPAAGECLRNRGAEAPVRGGVPTSVCGRSAPAAGGVPSAGGVPRSAECRAWRLGGRVPTRGLSGRSAECRGQVSTGAGAECPPTTGVARRAECPPAPARPTPEGSGRGKGYLERGKGGVPPSVGVRQGQECLQGGPFERSARRWGRSARACGQSASRPGAECPQGRGLRVRPRVGAAPKSNPAGGVPERPKVPAGGVPRGGSAGGVPVRAGCPEVGSAGGVPATASGVPVAGGVPGSAAARHPVPSAPSCGRSASQGRSAQEFRVPRLETLGGAVPQPGSTGGVPTPSGGVPRDLPSARLEGGGGGVPKTGGRRAECPHLQGRPGAPRADCTGGVPAGAPSPWALSTPQKNVSRERGSKEEVVGRGVGQKVWRPRLAWFPTLPGQ
jgi:hypothetical protein